MNELTKKAAEAATSTTTTTVKQWRQLAVTNIYKSNYKPSRHLTQLRGHELVRLGGCRYV